MSPGARQGSRTGARTVYSVVRAVDHPDSHMVGSDSLYSPTPIAERPAAHGKGFAVANLLLPAFYAARQRRQFVRRSADIRYRLGQKRSSRPVVTFEMCNSSLSALRCPRHSGTSRQQRRQAQGHCDVVTQCGFAPHMVASRPASRVHDISARRKSKVEHSLLISQMSWQVQFIVV